MTSLRRVAAVIFFLCFGALEAHANGIDPILNFFHKDNWIPASIVALVIISIELLLLCRLIKSVGIYQHLWRCFVFNLASSATGSLLLLGLNRDSYYISHGFHLIIPLFVVTVLTEAPMFRLLYRKFEYDWPDAASITAKINIISYVGVIVLEIIFVIGWISLADRKDAKELREWSKPDILHESSGIIYSSNENLELLSFNVKTIKWTVLTNLPDIDPYKWDVSGTVIAFAPRETKKSKKGTLMISSVTNSSNFREFTLYNEVGTNMASGSTDLPRIVDIALSPDARKVAVLWKVNGVAAQKDESSYYDLGAKCMLLVLNLETGEAIFKSNRWASDRGLCWFADSKRLLFTSLQDETLYRTTPLEMKGNRSLGYSLAAGKFDAALYEINLETGHIQWFAEGSYPTLANNTGQFLVEKGERYCVLDEAGVELRSFKLPRTSRSTFVLSPDGKFILGKVAKHNPLKTEGLLTVISLEDPTRRHILNSRRIYRSKWLPHMASDITSP